MPHTFTQKVWIVGGVFLFLVAIFWSFISNVLSLILADALIASYFNDFSNLIRKKNKWKRGASLAVSIAAIFIFIFLLAWFIGGQGANAGRTLSESLPTINSKSNLDNSAIERKIFHRPTR
jgi:predicted PurR-regulated permease PerM